MNKEIRTCRIIDSVIGHWDYKLHKETIKTVYCSTEEKYEFTS